MHNTLDNLGAKRGPDEAHSLSRLPQHLSTSIRAAEGVEALDVGSDGGEIRKKEGQSNKTMLMANSGSAAEFKVASMGLAH